MWRRAGGFRKSSGKAASCGGKAGQCEEQRLYRHHPHRVRGTNQRKKSGPKTRSFHLGKPARPNCRVFRLTELLRRIEDIVSPTIVGLGYELVRLSMSRG